MAAVEYSETRGGPVNSSHAVLAVDVGGSSVKILVTGQKASRKVSSGRGMTARRMASAVKRLARGWKYDHVSIGYPGPVIHGHPIHEPFNLGGGWVGFDFRKAFGRPVKVINDAAMQALGSYHGGRMLFLGLGTGLGAAMIVDNLLEPMELGHLTYKHGKTYEDYLGKHGLRKSGKKKWRRHVFEIAKRFSAALEADYVVLGGGNAKKLKKLPAGMRRGNNRNAFLGGFRLWEK
jgi:polyphosphate glucokinase